MAKGKKVSMQEIADALEISKVTVSKALNNKDGVSEELKSKIFRTAKEFGYMLPDYGQRRTMKVAIIMSSRFAQVSDTGKFYMGMYEKIVHELQLASCVSIMLTPSAGTVEKDLGAVFDQERIDGIILLGILERGVREKVDEILLPKVYVDIYDRTHKSDSVVSENIYSTYEMAEYLVNMGHKEIGFVGTVEATTSILDRYLGYQRAILENKMELREEWLIPDRTIEGEAIELILPKVLPTAFVCNCDETAFRLVQVLNGKGLKVPRDISIVSFDDDIYANLCTPKLTTVAVNLENIGKVTAKRMLKYMEDPKKKAGEVHRISGKNIFRESVRDLNIDV